MAHLNDARCKLLAVMASSADTSPPILGKEGHHITGLDLHPTEVPYFDRVIRGSILSERHLEEALEGVDTVIHTAAIVEEGGDVERFNKLNVDGARLVAEVAKTRGAQPPPLVVGHGLRLQLPGPSIRDSAALAEWQPLLRFENGSEAILKPLADESFRIIIRNGPGDVIGVRSIPWVTRPLDLMRRRLFALPNGGRGRFNPISCEGRGPRASSPLAADIPTKPTI